MIASATPQRHDIRGQRSGDHLADVVLDRAHFLHRRDDRCRVIPPQFNQCGLFGGIGALAPIAMPSLGCFNDGASFRPLNGAFDPTDRPVAGGSGRLGGQLPSGFRRLYRQPPAARDPQQPPDQAPVPKACR